MALRSEYICQKCEYSSRKWVGKCPSCGEWNSMVETVIERPGKKSGGSGNRLGSAKKPVKLSSLSVNKSKRISVGISELDRVLGGGMVQGQVILIAGEPGIGKSTILMQLADKLGGVLYVSGEESVSQVAIRAKRLGVKKTTIHLAEETNVDAICDMALSFGKGALKTVIVDSIQTVYTSDLSGMAGSVGQVRECTYRLVRYAKENNVCVIIVGHVTKQGSVAGPAVLAHLVDSVLWFEGDRVMPTRMLRAVKNRFGPTDEVGVFVMGDKGLESVSNPENLFVTGDLSVAGNVVSCVVKGLRPMLVEIQSLVNPTKLAYPKRIVQGIDPKRYELLIAVLEKRCGLALFGQDCYTTVSGGINLKNDPSVDLAVCLSLASSYLNKGVKKAVVFGEVGLDGRIRKVVQGAKREKEAKRLGYGVLTVGESSLASVIKKGVK